MIYPRSKYVRIYVPVSSWGKRCIIHEENRVACYTDYEQANLEATKEGFIVVSLDWFLRKTLAHIINPPTALIVYSSNGKKYHAAFDATPDDLRTLNQIMPSDIDRAPAELAELIAKRRVWEISQ